jgi:hypothetical protein
MCAEQQLRGLVDTQSTALQTVAATMQRVFELFDARATVGEDREEALRTGLDTLEASCKTVLPVRNALVSEEISPHAFMVLMINTLMRVLPTYAEIPLNLAMHGVHGDLYNYGLIALNVNDEAGGGDPRSTHPMLFNRSAAVLARIFGVPQLSLKVGRAALILKLRKGSWSDRREALAIVETILRQDEYGQRLSRDEILEVFDRAMQYVDFIAPEAVECYQWRMNILADLVSGQLRGSVNSHDGYVTLISMLAVREAAASDPSGIFRSLSTMILRYGGYLDGDVGLVREALGWSDAHVDEALGEQAGYEGHSVEEDHAVQALGAVLDHIHDDRDLLMAIESMNAINGHRIKLWEGTVRVVEAQEDNKLSACGVADAVYEQVRRERMHIDV